MIIVCGTATIRRGALRGAEPAMRAMIEASRAEPGCRYYSYGADVLDPDTIIALEYWNDQAALDAHFKTPHMAAWRQKLGQLGVVTFNVKAYDAGPPRSL